MTNDTESDPGKLADSIVSGESIHSDEAHFKSVAGDVKLAARANYVYIEDLHTEVFSYIDIVLRVTDEDECTISYLSRQTARFYTHYRNRIGWTGPVPTLVLLDRGRSPVGNVWQLPQINRICSKTDERHIESKKIANSFAQMRYAHIAFTPYKYWLC